MVYWYIGFRNLEHFEKKANLAFKEITTRAVSFGHIIQDSTITQNAVLQLTFIPFQCKTEILLDQFTNSQQIQPYTNITF